MKKILLALLIPFSSTITAKIKYDKSKKIYYSTGFTKNMNKERYHCLAEFVNLLLENASQPDINLDIESMFGYIQGELLFDGSPEAMLLLSDLTELFGKL